MPVGSNRWHSNNNKTLNPIAQLLSYPWGKKLYNNNSKRLLLSKTNYLAKLQNQLVSRSNQDSKKFKSELKKAEKRLEQLDKIMSKLYEDRALEKISEERYILMNSKYEVEYIELLERANHLKTELETADESPVNAYQFVNMVEKYVDIQELNARILNELIEKIVVHEKEIINGEKYQTVEIYYKFVGLMI